MDALEKGSQSRITAVQSATRGKSFQRKAQLDVGGAERVASKPFAVAELTFELVEVQLELRIDEAVVDLVGDALGNRLDEEWCRRRPDPV